MLKRRKWHRNIAETNRNYVILFRAKQCTFDSVKKIIAISLLLILLLSNVGLSVATHYCGGHAVKSGLSLGGSALDCGMSERSAASPECDRSGNHLKPERCCENYRQVLQTDDNHSPDVISAVLDIAFGLVPHHYDFLSKKLFSREKSPKAFFYPPPPLPARDVQVLFQSFLI